VTVQHPAAKARRRSQLQAATAQAPAYAAPWTPAQDRFLLHAEGTVAERARQLGRTYYAANYRLQQLRGNQGVKLVRR
jgi:hypothetical protein